MTKKLTRSHTDKKIFGVCGGLAKFMSVDATILRLAVAVASVVFNIGLAAILYTLCAIIIPMDEENKED